MCDGVVPTDSGWSMSGNQGSVGVHVDAHSQHVVFDLVSWCGPFVTRPPSPRTPYNTHPWPHVSSVVAFFVSFGPRGEGTNPFKTSGPEGSREENATNPTTAGLPTGSGVVQAPPTSLHIRGFGAPEGKAIFARAIRAPCRGSRGKPRQDSNPGQDRSQATGAGFHMCPCSGWVTPSTDLVDAITRSSGLR